MNFLEKNYLNNKILEKNKFLNFTRKIIILDSMYFLNRAIGDG